MAFPGCPLVIDFDAEASLLLVLALSAGQAFRAGPGMVAWVVVLEIDAVCVEQLQRGQQLFFVLL